MVIMNGKIVQYQQRHDADDSSHPDFHDAREKSAYTGGKKITCCQI